MNIEWENEAMSDHNYTIYCYAWCAIQDGPIDYSYDEYQYSGKEGIIFA